MLLRKNLISVPVMSALLGALVLTSPAMGGGRKDVLKLIPEDAWGFAIVPSLNTLDEKAKLLQQIVGQAIQAPISPLILMQLDAGDAIDMTKPICIVMMDVHKFDGPDNAAVAIVPVKDPKALLDALAAEELSEGVHKCTVMGEPAYAATKGRSVILGPSKECVLNAAKTKKTLGETLHKARLDAVAESDLYLSISAGAIKAFNEMVMPMVQMLAAASMGDPEGKSFAPFTKMLNELATLDFSVSLDDAGLTLAMLISARQDSDLDKLLRETKNTKKALLAGLPKERYLFAAGGTSQYSEHSEKFGGAAASLGMILQSLQIEGVSDEALETLETAVTRLAKSSEALALSFSALPEGSDGLIGFTIVIETGDSKGYVADLRKIYKAVWAVADDEDFETLKEHVVHTPDAEAVGDKKVDTIRLELDGLADMFDLVEDEMTDAYKVVGKELAVRFGPADEKHVVITFGGGAERFKAVCATLKSGGGLSADAGISKLAGRLPSPRASEGYLSLENLLRLAKDIAKVLGQEEDVPFEVPAVDAPIAVSTVQIGAVQRTDFIVPMKLITAVKEFIEKQVFAEPDEVEGEKGDEVGDDAKEDEDDEILASPPAGVGDSSRNLGYTPAQQENTPWPSSTHARAMRARRSCSTGQRSARTIGTSAPAARSMN